MAVSIAKLAIQFVADTSGMVAGTKKAEGALGGFVSRAKTIGNSLAGAFGFIGATTAILGFVGGIRKSFKELDDLAKMSTKLGVPVEQLQLLDHAASLSGASTEQVAKAFAKMNDSIGEGVMGNKIVNDAFLRMGLSADKLAAKAPEQAFLDIADALNAVPNQALKTKLAMDIFGRSAVDLLPLLAEGREGIAKLFEEREGLGIFNREELARIEAANDAWDTMLTSIKQIGGEFAVTLAPAIEEFAKQVTALQPEVRKLLEGVSGEEGKGLMVQQGAAKVTDALLSGDTKGIGEGLVMMNAVPNQLAADIATFFSRPKAGPMTPEKLAELGKLSTEMEDALGGAAMTDAERQGRSLIDLNNRISQQLTDQMTPDVFAAGKDADKLFGKFIKPAAGNVVDMLKDADRQLSAALAANLGEDSFTGDTLGTAAKLMDKGVEEFAMASSTAQKRINDLSAVPVIGEASALQRGTAAALTQARKNFEDMRRAEQEKVEQEQLKTLEKIEKNTGRQLDEFKTVSIN